MVVLTLNEERNLPDCLASLEGLPAKVFVVDSGSTDATVELARKAGAEVVSHPFETWAAQRNWAIARLTKGFAWELHLDADERLSPELRDSIFDVVERGGDPGVRGYLVAKRTVFMGRWIRHGGHYPSYHLRLFREGAGRVENRLYDQHFLVDGPVGRLRGDLVDVITSDLHTWVARHNRWTDLEAREVLEAEQGRDQVRALLRGNPIERRRFLRNRVYYRFPPFVRAFLYWGYRYFLRLGFLDGREGLVFHFLQGFWTRFLTDAKLLELRRQARGRTGPRGAAARAGRARQPDDSFKGGHRE